MIRRFAPGAALVLLTGGCFVGSIYAEDLPSSAERHRARTRDGWELELVRYRPSGPPRGRPVLLCHGMSGNARNLDLDDEHSLARWLASRGREAWAMSLRDTGGSQRVDRERNRLGTYDFDTYVYEDLPAAIRTVREATGAPAVDYVGHSMGGIILYAYLAGGGTDIGAGVALGSPARFRFAGRSDWLARNLVAPIARRTGSASMESLAHLFAPLGGEVRLEERLVGNPDDIAPATWRKLMAVGAGNISPAVSHQILGWVDQDCFTSHDGGVDYAARLADVRTPVLVVAGKLDRIATVSMVKAAYRHLGGPKAFVLAAEENGFQADYGHLDLMVGDHVRDELWPRVGQFLDRYR